MGFYSVVQSHILTNPPFLPDVTMVSHPTGQRFHIQLVKPWFQYRFSGAHLFLLAFQSNVVKKSGCGFRHEIIPVEEKTGAVQDLGLYHDLNVRYIKQWKGKIYFSERYSIVVAGISKKEAVSKVFFCHEGTKTQSKEKLKFKSLCLRVFVAIF
jgi:hypothetical protein